MKNSTKKLKVTTYDKRCLQILLPMFTLCFNVSIEGRQRRSGRGASEKDVTPPLLAKVQGNLEVLC